MRRTKKNFPEMFQLIVELGRNIARINHKLKKKGLTFADMIKKEEKELRKKEEPKKKKGSRNGKSRSRAKTFTSIKS
uniref:Uncharacterized protein n=1 Tax=Arundo donax TaxID=35708 RepID=A0A0A8YK41_ARUDO